MSIPALMGWRMTEISGGPSLALDLDGSLLKDEKCAWMACFLPGFEEKRIKNAVFAKKKWKMFCS